MLSTLLRIRSQAVDEAKRTVAEALLEHQRRQRESEAAEARFADELRAAADLQGSDETVNSFARWLPLGRDTVECSRISERDASGDLDRARVVLGLANAAHRAVESLMEQQAAERRIADDREAQKSMDEVARRPR